MSNPQPSSDFHNAANYLSSASSLAKVSTTIKLELYGLFKYLTSSRAPSTSRPSIFDMTGRAKWDAWAGAGKKYESAYDVEQRYLEIAKSLGWTGETVIQDVAQPPPKPQAASGSSTADEDGIWDSDSQGSSSSSGGGAGMGVHVSSMEAPTDTHDLTLHGLALANDTTGISTLLREHPETDLNARDEFGYAPIHLACDRGNAQVVKLLLERGADSSIKDPDDLSPLELSKEAGHVEIVKLLESSS
ncbi:hypothetical protein D9619_003422 [Psilocybe cf. subviscida]|uniref:ACB domain-containing protein n=1 Tax=Psilocybe cf. subviscida TaxID=2480587 RepID=A0A8H5AVU0_9AGAR|nr:hypothetical protein D9619_003422 [Psilocybe cf. subviscida]